MKWGHQEKWVHLGDASKPSVILVVLRKRKGTTCKAACPLNHSRLDWLSSGSLVSNPVKRHPLCWLLMICRQRIVPVSSRLIEWRSPLLFWDPEVVHDGNDRRFCSRPCRSWLDYCTTACASLPFCLKSVTRPANSLAVPVEFVRAMWQIQ